MDVFKRIVPIFVAAFAATSFVTAQTPAAPAPKAPAAKKATPVPAANTAKPSPGSPAADAAKPSKAAPTAAPAANFDKVIIRVGDEKVSVGEFERLVDALPEQYRVMARGPAKRQVAEQMVAVKTLAQEARRRKLDQTPGFKAQVAFQSENILAGALFQDMQATLQVDEAAARKYFEDHKNEYEKVKARHILVRVKGSPMQGIEGQKELSDEEALAKAKELRKRIVAGEDFAEVAKAESDDTTNKSKGGDLGAFGRGQMVPAFDQAAFALKVKEISEPVKTPFGYHLIRIDEREGKTFDEMRPELEKKMRPDLARQAVNDLRKATTIEIDESYFGPAAPSKP